jgi:hypothetical protein
MSSFASFKERASADPVPSLCLIASAIPLVILATILVLRSGFASPMAGLVRLAGISLLLVNVSAFGSHKQWIFSPPAMSLWALVGVTAVGLYLPVGRSPVCIFLAIAGVAVFLWNLLRVMAGFGVLRVAALLALGAFLATYAQSMYWRENTAHDILFPEAIVTGRIYTDVIEQAAVVNMISTFRLASTGLDGLLPLKYHNGSLWIAEALRSLCGFDAVEFVAFGYGLLLMPLYVISFWICAHYLRSFVQRSGRFLTPTFVIACVVVFVGVFPFKNDPMQLNFNETIINSDSFLLAVTLSLFFIGAAVQFCETVDLSNFSRSRINAAGVAIGIPAILCLIGVVKISQMYLLLAVATYLWWRVRELRAWPFALGTALSAVLLALLMYSEVGANKASLALFSFDRIHPEWVPYFFFLYYLWVWLFVIVWARRSGVVTLSDFFSHLRSRNTLAVEIVFVVALAGAIPYLLLNFYSPAWKFFTEFQGLVAGLLVVAFLSELKIASLPSRIRDGSLPLWSLLGLGLMLAVAAHLGMTTFGTVHRLLERNGEDRAVLAGNAETEWRPALRQIRTGRAVVSPAWAVRIQVLDCLRSIGERPAEQRRNLVLYIPKTNRSYWDMRQVGAGSTPFIAPALARVPMVEGLPEYDDIGWAAVGWGYPQYNLPTAPEPATEKLDQAIEKARSAGFRDLLVFRGVSPEGCQLQPIKLE